VRAARGSGRGRAVCAGRRTTGVGDQRPGRGGQDPGHGGDRQGVAGGRARPGHRHHRIAVGAKHAGRRRDRVLQQRPVPRPPAWPTRGEGSHARQPGNPLRG
jgi:hypothetical protein